MNRRVPNYANKIERLLNAAVKATLNKSSNIVVYILPRLAKFLT